MTGTRGYTFVELLVVTTILLGATSVCCGLPGLLISLMTDPVFTRLDFGPALAGLHAASTPLWAKLLLAIGPGLVTLSSFVAAMALLKTSARTHIRSRTT